MYIDQYLKNFLSINFQDSSSSHLNSFDNYNEDLTESEFMKIFKVNLNLDLEEDNSPHPCFLTSTQTPTKAQFNILKNDNSSKLETKTNNKEEEINSINNKIRNQIPNFENLIIYNLEKPSYITPEQIDFLVPNNLPIEDGEEVNKFTNYLLTKKRKKSTKKSKKEKNGESKNKLGRFKKNSGLTGEHDKNKDNNLTVKYKTIDIALCLNFINYFLDKDEKLLNIDPKKFAKNINARENILFNKLSHYEIFSNDISSAYKKSIIVTKNYNQKIMEKYVVNDNTNFKNNKEQVINMKRFEYRAIQLHLENEEIKNKYSKEVRDKVPKIEEVIKKIYDKEIKNKDKNINDHDIKRHMKCLLITAYNIDYINYIKHPRKKRPRINSKNIP